MLFAWLVLVGLAFLCFRSKDRDLNLVTKLVATVSAIVVAMGIVQLTSIHLEARAVAEKLARESVFPQGSLKGKQSRLHQSKGELPDIYFIILDAYGRQDQLEDICGYDNSEFLQFLRSKGFYVADQSHSNYASTFLSLASSMNLRYLDNEAKHIGPQSLDRGPIYEMIQQNDLARYLKVKGYRVVHLNTWAGSTGSSAIADESSPATLPEFHSVFLKTTMLEPFVWRLSSMNQAELLLHHFQRLKEIPKIDNPTFTFAHIICPHGPFVFDREGVRDVKGETEWKGNEEDYVDQLIYVNKQVREIVDTILTEAKSPPVIIIQSDHGTAFLKDESRPFEEQPAFVKERMSILNAMYVPESCREQLYDSITPVNTFRILLNSLFGEKFPLLPDRILFSWYSKPYTFMDVTQKLDSKDNGNVIRNKTDTYAKSGTE